MVRPGSLSTCGLPQPSSAAASDRRRRGDWHRLLGLCALAAVAPAVRAADPPKVGEATRVDSPDRTIATATVVAVPTTNAGGRGVAFEPAQVDLGEVRPSIGIDWKISVRNATGAELTITRVVPSGSGTTPPHTATPIPVGESGEFGVTGGRHIRPELDAPEG